MDRTEKNRRTQNGSVQLLELRERIVECEDLSGADKREVTAKKIL